MQGVEYLKKQWSRLITATRKNRQDKHQQNKNNQKRKNGKQNNYIDISSDKQVKMWTWLKKGKF